MFSSIIKPCISHNLVLEREREREQKIETEFVN